MPAPEKPQRTPSRNVVIGAVVVLVAVAVVGIVLGRKAQVQADATKGPRSAASGAASAAVAAVEPMSGPNEVIFDPTSSTVPSPGAKSIAKFAETARGQTGTVRVISRFLTGANRDRDFALANARSHAVRAELEKDGIGVERMRFELMEVPVGALKPTDVNRIELASK